MVRVAVCAFAVSGGALVGCQAPAAATAPTTTLVQLDDYDTFIDDTLSLLRRYDFAPDYVDRTRGLVITEPATSGQWFEPWRVDSRGGYQVLEASLHTTRRAVTVNIEPADSDGSDNYRVTVRVDKSRYSAPERQVTTASGALAIYNERLPTTEGLRGARSRDEQWVPQGRDAALEEYLLQRLTGRTVASQAADE